VAAAPRGALARALSHRDSRIFFGGSMVAWTGLWMQRIAVSWLAWELTGSAFWVGMLAFCDLAPAVLISPIAGAMADRVDRLRMAVTAQLAIGVQAALVAGLTATGGMTIELLLALEVIGGTLGSFAQPVRQTLMPGIVPRGDLPAAVALNSLCFAVARFVGPAIAAPTIAWFGVVPAIAANSVGYVVTGLSLLTLRIAAEDRRGHAASASLFGEVAEGFRFVARHPGFGPLLAYGALTALLLRGLQEILPPFVERLFGRGVESLGVLTACFGVGALAAGLWIANRGRLDGTAGIAVWSGGAMALATAGFVATDWFIVGMASAALIGATSSLHGISVQTLIQSATGPSLRGRMLSMWGLIGRGGPAVGALALGAAGEAFGLQLPTLIAVALSLLVFAWGLSRLDRIRRTLEGPQEWDLERG
jgi:hypothetical protein